MNAALPQERPQVGISRRRQNLRASELVACDHATYCPSCADTLEDGATICPGCGCNLLPPSLRKLVA